MDIFDEKIDELLAKHLAGECSPEEEAAIGRWRSESPEHRKHLEDLEWLWQRSPEALTPAPRPVDTEAALQRVKNRLKTDGGASPLRWQRSFWMRAAAVFLLAVAAVYWWQTGNTPEPVRIAATGTALTDTLTDGSVVTLERESGLTLAGHFNRRERRLRLEGEAFFAVAPDTIRPFVVEVQEVEVRVVGTAFTVDNATDLDKVTVLVTEGKVQVSANNRSLLLLPGEQATYDRTNGTLTRTVAAPEQGISGKRMFRFEATPLSTVARQLSESYNVPIVLKNKSLENCLLHARYNNLPLERVLELIAESFSISVKKEGDTYVLDGAGCGE
jgi:transmembrane sensor